MIAGSVYAFLWSVAMVRLYHVSRDSQEKPFHAGKFFLKVFDVLDCAFLGKFFSFFAATAATTVADHFQLLTTIFGLVIFIHSIVLHAKLYAISVACQVPFANMAK